MNKQEVMAKVALTEKDTAPPKFRSLCCPLTSMS